MDTSNKTDTPRSPMRDLGNINVVTSTPLLRSEIGRQLVKKHFIKHFPKDISMSILESKISQMSISLNIKDQTKTSPPMEPFIFRKEHDSTAPIYEFHTPKSISPETIEKFKKLFEETPKVVMRKRIRL